MIEKTIFTKEKLRQEFVLESLSTKSMFLSNIELNMSERSSTNAELRIVDEGQESREEREMGKINPMKGQMAVIMTEVLKARELNQSPSGGNEQSSDEEAEKINASSTTKVRILRFEDTLSKEDCKYFKIIYESLLLEGRAGNLTRSTFEMVLAQRPPTWVQVMYEQLKHLIINSETFRNKRKIGYGVQIETKQDKMNRSVGKREKEDPQTTDTSYTLSRDGLIDKETMGIIDKWVCW